MTHKSSINIDMLSTLTLIKTDLVQARIICNSAKLSILKLIYLFIRSKTCRIHTFIRLRSKSRILSELSRIYLNKFFIEVGTRTKIGSHFFLPHPRCIIIANEVIIGSHVHIGQNSTIGGSFNKVKVISNYHIQKLPVIGNNVIISPGVVIGGPVTIGNNVVIGANSVITKDVPSGKIVMGQNLVSTRNIQVPDACNEYYIID